MHAQLDFIILGAGPAGLQMAYYLQQKDIQYAVLERKHIAGSFFEKMPRHRQLISINKRYTGYTDPAVNLRWDWNSLLTRDFDFLFTNFSENYFPDRKEYVDYLNQFVARYDLNIEYGVDIVEISKEKNFILKSHDGKQYTCRHLIIATGVSQPYVPDIPGIETTDLYVTVSFEKHFFRNKRVLIIGKGNSGFEVADDLIDTASLIHLASPHPLNMAWRSHYVGHLRAVNNNVLDTYMLKSQNALINAHVRSIDFQKNQYAVTFAYAQPHEEQETLYYDRVITATGFRFDAGIFHPLSQPELIIDNRFPAMSSWYESTNISDLYFIGTLMQARDYKKKQSGFVHGFRYNIDFLRRYFQMRYENHSIYRMKIDNNPDALVDAVIKQINQTSALWQQTGYLAEVLLWREEKWEYYDAMPVDFVTESDFSAGLHIITITLEFCQEIFDNALNPFAITRVHKDDYLNANQSASLHPIVRHYFNHILQSEHHIIEDFANVWSESVHVNPLKEYFINVFSEIKMKAHTSIYV